MQNHIEWGTESMQGANVDALDGKSIMPLLLGAVRADVSATGHCLTSLRRGLFPSGLRDWQDQETIMTEWFITCNPSDYDVDGAFHELKKIDWKQSNDI